MENKINMVAVGIAIAVAVAVVLFYWYWSRTNAVPPAPEQSDSPAQETTADASVAPPSANPLEEVLPEDNPIEKTNPFEYENPFN